jgi:hypothetical protein
LEDGTLPLQLLWLGFLRVGLGIEAEYAWARHTLNQLSNVFLIGAIDLIHKELG